jgi:hypothetical protein
MLFFAGLDRGDADIRCGEHERVTRSSTVAGYAGGGDESSRITQ